MKVLPIATALAASSCIAALTVPALVQAQTQTQTQTQTQAQAVAISYDIPAGSLKSALDAYGQQSGQPIIYLADQVRTVSSRGYRGTAQPNQALDGVLAGTGFNVRAGEAGSVAIVRASDDGAGVGGASSGEPAADRGAIFSIEEIVVTARKREERLSDVPTAITAFSGQDLEQTGGVDFDDYAMRVPGLGFSNFGAASLRGQGPLINIRGLPDTGYYIGETPIPSANLKLVDINRVEVLKGPQGTLYGASSMGGLVKVVPNIANLEKLEVRGEGTLSATRYGGINHDVNAMVNAPLVADRLALRIVGYRTHQAGFIDKVPATDGFGGLDLDSTIKDTNVEKVWGLRASLVARPNDWLDIEVSAMHENQQAEDAALADTFVRGVTGNFGNLSPIREPIENKVSLYNVTLRADADAFTITSSTSYYNLDAFMLEDRALFGNVFVGLLTSQAPAVVAGAIAAGALPAGSTVVGGPNFSFFSPGSNTTDVKVKRWVQELRISSNGEGPLNWTVGGFFQDTSTDNFFFGSIPGANAAGTVSVNAPGLGVIPLPLVGSDIIINRASGTDTRELGLFGEISYEVIDRVTLAVGGRFYKSRFAQELTDLSTSMFVPTVLNSPRSSVSDSGFVPKVNLSFRPAEDTMLYAQVSKGFRASGLTDTSGVSPLCAAELAEFGLTRGDTVPLKSDTLWSYEGGAKLSRLDRRVFVDAAVFYNQWSDMQQSFAFQCGMALAVNAGKARSYGAELSVDVQPAQGLRFGVAAGYLNSKITESDSRSILHVGDSFMLAPEWTFAANGQYGFPVSTGLNGYVRADYQYQSSAKFDFQGLPSSKKPAYDVVNARAGITSDRWEAVFFVNNIFDERAILADYTLGAAGMAVPLGSDNRRIRPLTPRTIGINISVRY